MSDTKERLGAVNRRLLELFNADRETMLAYKALNDSAVQEGNIPTGMKELIATAIAVAKGCDDCILYHVNEAKKHGASRESLVEVLAVAIEMSGGPGTVYGARAVEIFDTL